MNLNFKQVLAILAAILGVLMVSTSQLTDLFGSGVAKTIGSAAGLLTLMINSVLAVVTGQSSMIKDVAAMTGVEPIRINAQANSTLAAIATDPSQPNIGGTTAQVQNELREIAKG